jgi:hypothetical protein
MNELFDLVSGMAPEKALSQISSTIERLLADLDSDARERFLMGLISQSEGDKVSGLVHL